MGSKWRPISEIKVMVILVSGAIKLRRWIQSKAIDRFWGNLPWRKKSMLSRSHIWTCVQSDDLIVLFYWVLSQFRWWGLCWDRCCSSWRNILECREKDPSMWWYLDWRCCNESCWIEFCLLLQGHLDVELNDAGRQQAEKVLCLSL